MCILRKQDVSTGSCGKKVLGEPNTPGSTTLSSLIGGGKTSGSTALSSLVGGHKGTGSTTLSSLVGGGGGGSGGASKTSGSTALSSLVAGVATQKKTCKLFVLENYPLGKDFYYFSGPLVLTFIITHCFS